MNKLILISFALLLSSFLCLAQNKGEVSEKLEQFAEDICHELILINDSLDEDLLPEDFSKYVVAKFKEYLKIEKDDPDFNLKILEFWNKNSKYFVCLNSYSTFRVPQHFTKRLIDMNMNFSVLKDFLLFSTPETKLSMNAIQIVEGKEETVIDYLDKLLAEPLNDSYNGGPYSFKQLKKLRTILISKYDAKKASELKE